jgi:hypothetical protein
MKYVLTFCLLLISCLSFSQKNDNFLGERQLNFSIGRSKHGTGDMRGLIFNTEYSKRFKNRLSWIAGIGGTIHDGVRPLFFTYPDGSEIDGSIRYTTAGLQGKSQIGYSLIKTNTLELQIRAGALLRYQTSSYYDGVSILYPAAGTGVPFPVIYFTNISPQRTFTVGGNAEIFYNYSITPKILIGVLAGLQTDTNGDTITQLSLSIGRRF